MKRRSLAPAVSIVVSAGVLFGCRDAAFEPSSEAPSFVVGADPDPSKAGLFLGTNVTNTVCFASVPDTDHDGLIDRCESALAAAFAPELAYSSSDNTGRQPRWAARPLSGGKVRLAYLLSLYRDLGAVGCPYGPIPCGGHYGDSEILVLDVYYHGNTQHWLLDQAVYSAHGVYNWYPRLFSPYPSMNYPAKQGGYPRAFLSLRKHAGYRSDHECDTGELGLDECEADTFRRVAAGPLLNLGSRGTHTAAQDCIAGTTSATAAQIECYWTDRAFGGWQGRTPKAGAYSPILGFFGF
jgi:hypothetical protein